MKRKLLSFVFSFFLLVSTPLSLFNQTAFAAQAGQTQFTSCDNNGSSVNLSVTYTPTSPSTTDTDLNITIKNNGLPKQGKDSANNPLDYKLIVVGPDDSSYLSNSVVNGKVYPLNFLNNDTYNNKITAKNGQLGSSDPAQLLKTIAIFLYSPTAEVLNEQAQTYFYDEKMCYLTIDLSDATNPPPDPNPNPNGDCEVILNYPKIYLPGTSLFTTLTYFTPDDGISFRVKNLNDPDNANIRRGIILLNGSDHDKESSASCPSNPVLSGGPDKTGWVNIHTAFGSVLPTGNYTLNINDSCSIFGSPQAPVLCHKTFKVCLSGDCLETGNNCTPGVSKCPDEAPYCLHKDGDTGPFQCQGLPGIKDKCDTIDKPGQCFTAIGWFGFEPDKFAKSVLALILSLAGGIVLLFLIINGYKLMTSSGDPEKVKEARESIISAIAGLIFIIFSLVILQFLTVDILQLPGFKP